MEILNASPTDTSPTAVAQRRIWDDGRRSNASRIAGKASSPVTPNSSDMPKSMMPEDKAPKRRYFNPASEERASRVRATNR